MLWFFSTIITFAIIVYVIWVSLRYSLDESINFIDGLQHLSNQALQAELKIIADNIPPLAKIFWGINIGLSNLLNILIDVIRPRIIRLKNLMDIVLVTIIGGKVLFLTSIIIKFKYLTIFLAILFMISGTIFLEIYAPILDTLTHSRLRRSTRPLALVNAYFLNLLIVCSYWYFVNYSSFTIALTALSLLVLLLMGFGFIRHYYLRKIKNEKKVGWYSQESNAPGKALAFSAIMLILTLILVKFSETALGEAIIGIIRSIIDMTIKNLSNTQTAIL